MVGIVRSGNSIHVDYNGITGPNVSLPADMNEAGVRTAVQQAISRAAGMFASDPAAVRAISRINVDTAVARLIGRVAPATQRDHLPPGATPHRVREGEEGEHAAPRGEARPRQPAAAPQPQAPVINAEWIRARLVQAAAGDQTGEAATLSHRYGIYINNALFPPGTVRTREETDGRTTVIRTDLERTMAIEVFNALYQNPLFSSYLSQAAAEQPSIAALQLYLSQHQQGLGAETPPGIIRAAETYTRYFLLNVVAAGSAYSAYRTELGTLQDISWRLTRLSKATTLTAADERMAGIEYSYCAGQMDAQTFTAALLFLRRYNLQHPPTAERGRVRPSRAMTQAQITSWTAPRVEPLLTAPNPYEGETATEAPPAAPGSRSGTTVTSSTEFRIGVIGDSITQGIGGADYTRLLRGMLSSPGRPAPPVDNYGVSSESILQIERRFRGSILDHQPPYTTVVIQGGVNNIMGMSVADAEAAFTRMIRAARDQGIRVVLLTITPWAAVGTSGVEQQRRTAEINQWLLRQATADGNVIVVNTSSLGEQRSGLPGPALQARYERHREDGTVDALHPNEAGMTEIARLIYQALQTAHALPGTVPGAGPRTEPTELEGRSPPAPTDPLQPLRQFAESHWSTLTADLLTYSRDGDPARIVGIMRTSLPDGTRDVDAAMLRLGRPDVASAFDRVYNLAILRDSAFAEYCRTAPPGSRAASLRAGELVRGAGIQLDYRTTQEGSDDARAAAIGLRRRIVSTVLDYINWRASQADDFGRRLRGDLITLYRAIGITGRSDLDVNATADLRALAAIGVYRWRLAHRDAEVGAWRLTALELRITVPAEAQSLAPPAQAVSPAQAREPPQRTQPPGGSGQVQLIP